MQDLELFLGTFFELCLFTLPLKADFVTLSTPH